MIFESGKSKTIQNKLRAYAGSSIDKWLRLDVPEAANFRILLPQFQYFINIIEKLNLIPFDSLPESMLGDLEARLANAELGLQSIMNFSLMDGSHGDSNNWRQAIIIGFNSSLGELAQSSIAIIQAVPLFDSQYKSWQRAETLTLRPSLNRTKICRH